MSGAAAFPRDLLARVEDAGINASAPPQQRLLDGWLLRFCPGKAKRARCVNAVSAGRLGLADKLARCEQAYAEAGLPMFVRVTPFSEPEGLDSQLEALGLHKLDDTRVMVRVSRSAPPAKPMPRGMVVKRITTDAFAVVVGTLRGSTVLQQQAHAQRLLLSPVPFEAYVLEYQGELLCCAQIAIESNLVGLYDVFTALRMRGNGYASLLCAQLMAQASARASVGAYLQVEGNNAAARAVYHRLGFQDAYGYHYRCRVLGAS